MDVLSHLPVLCEDHDVPYVYVKSKLELGQAGATKRPTSCLMVVAGGGAKMDVDGEEEDFTKKYEECVESVKDLFTTK